MSDPAWKADGYYCASLHRAPILGCRSCVETLQQRIAELEARNEEVKRALPEWCQGPGIVGAVLHMTERIAELEGDCADMAGDVIADAGQRYGDGKGGIHTGLLHKYRRDVSTAQKYSEARGVRDD